MCVVIIVIFNEISKMKNFSNFRQHYICEFSEHPSPKNTLTNMLLQSERLKMISSSYGGKAYFMYFQHFLSGFKCGKFDWDFKNSNII